MGGIWGSLGVCPVDCGETVAGGGEGTPETLRACKGWGGAAFVLIGRTQRSHIEDGNLGRGRRGRPGRRRGIWGKVHLGKEPIPFLLAG